MKVSLLHHRVGLRDSVTRLPFRYGTACLTRCPQAVLEVAIEGDGRRQRGFSGDCLPPGWFDKTPGKSYELQIREMLRSFERAGDAFLRRLARPAPFFPAWCDVQAEIVSEEMAETGNPLLASFGVSMVERAILDAISRAAGLSFGDAVRENVFGIEPGRVHEELWGLRPRDWLPARSRDSIFVRHTVGLADPLTGGDVPAEERLNDGLPQSLEDYVEQTGLRYFKVKVSGDVDSDRERLRAIADILERHLGEEYHLTLDGNEQFHAASEFQHFVDEICRDYRLRRFLKHVLAVEQPLSRSIALERRFTEGIREISPYWPIIIDESDDSLSAYPRALSLGYRGVSSKNCKGPIKSILNAGLTWIANDRGRRRDYLMTGEDLCCVGVIPVQSDLALVATLGLEHAERNGHHYHPGLDYLPRAEQEEALRLHPDLYRRHRERIVPRLVEGRFEIGSLDCCGFGFLAEPDVEGAMVSPDDWDFGLSSAKE